MLLGQVTSWLPWIPEQDQHTIARYKTSPAETLGPLACGVESTVRESAWECARDRGHSSCSWALSLTPSPPCPSAIHPLLQTTLSLEVFLFAPLIVEYNYTSVLNCSEIY